MDIEQIAQICHGAVRAYCSVVGEALPPRWDRLEQAERDAAIATVNDLANAPGFIPADDPRERLIQCVAFALCWNNGQQPAQAENKEEIKGEVGQEFVPTSENTGPAQIDGATLTDGNGNPVNASDIPTGPVEVTITEETATLGAVGTGAPIEGVSGHGAAANDAVRTGGVE